MTDIFEEIVRVRREGISAALATVVMGEKGTPGKTSFRMLVFADGRILGTVGGGKLEAKVREQALRCLHDNKPSLLEYSLHEHGPDAIGVLCGGKVMVFAEPIVGRPKLYIFGGGHIGLSLAQFAKVLEFKVVVVDDREEFANQTRFPEAEVKCGDYLTVTRALGFTDDDSVVIVTHGHAHDEVVLKECLTKATQPKYVGMIGSKEKVATVFSHLRNEGIGEELLRKVKAPVGLSIGGKSPAEIALSIMAQIVAVRYGKET
jgi:xanthine dehydrogenase accessory factor